MLRRVLDEQFSVMTERGLISHELWAAAEFSRRPCVGGLSIDKRRGKGGSVVTSVYHRVARRNMPLSGVTGPKP